MGTETKIQWTGSTWTPIRARNLKTGKVGWHCEHATTGCELCYAESMNKRLGTGLPFKPGHRRDIEIFIDETMLTAPLCWRKPRRVFVCSMTDLFADFVTDEWIDRVFAVMALCPQHTFQILTKRAERMRAYFEGRRQQFGRASNLLAEMSITCSEAQIQDAADWLDLFDSGGRALPNVWLGVSAERQTEADGRIPHLLATPAAVRFVSLEPLLSAIDLTPWIGESDADQERGEAKLSWVIVGGESGRNARPFHIEWANSLVDQCRAANVACFVKQLGAEPMASGYPLECRDAKGGDWSEWPEHLRVREFPHALI